MIYLITFSLFNLLLFVLFFLPARRKIFFYFLFCVGFQNQNPKYKVGFNFKIQTLKIQISLYKLGLRYCQRFARTKKKKKEKSLKPTP